MPTRRIDDGGSDMPSRCRHFDHEPAQHIVREPGLYEHMCPSCGQHTTFRVDAGPQFDNGGAPAGHVYRKG